MDAETQGARVMGSSRWKMSGKTRSLDNPVERRRSVLFDAAESNLQPLTIEKCASRDDPRQHAGTKT
jgi:hypothetical protein